MTDRADVRTTTSEMTDSTDQRIVGSDEQPAMPHDDRSAESSAIGVPRRTPALLHRRRLLDRFDREPAPALTVVQAGSGFGKTSLLADWIRSRPPGAPPAVWVTADESVRDPVAFWEETLHVLDRAGLVQGTGLSDVEVRGDIADVLPSALRRGFESLPTTVTLVVDGFERLVGTRVETDLIELLHRTENLRLVVATHVSSEICSVTTAAQLDTLMLDASALRFDDDEVRRLAADMNIDAAHRELSQLREGLDGWPFGIRAVLERRRRTESGSLADARNAIFGLPTGEPEPLDLTIAHQHLLASLDGLEGLDALTVTAVIDAFTLEQSEMLGADLDGHPVLGELESRGLGTWRGDAEPRQFRLHPVLRRALREELDRRPDATAEAFTRLANWHISRGEFARAFEAAIHAGRWELARRCVRSDLFQVLVRLRLHPEILRAVPRDVLRDEPLLMLVEGVARYAAGNQAKAVRMLLSAVAACERQRLTTRGAPTPDQVWVQGILTIALRLVGRYEIVPAALRRFLRMLDAVDDPDEHLDPSMLLIRTQSTITFCFLDEVDRAEQLAVSTGQEHRHMSRLEEANLYGLTAFTHARRGDMVRAHSAQLRIDVLGKPRQFDESFFAVTHHIADAWIALEQFDPDSAAAHLSLSDRHWSTMEYWPFALEARTHIEWQRRGAQSALLTLREGRAEKRLKAPIGAAMDFVLTALEVELLLASDLAGEAAAILAPNRVRRSVRLTVPKSRSLLLAGRWDQAAILADRHARRESQPWQNRADLLLISASANLRAGDRLTARERFDRAAEIAERTGVRTPFASMPRTDLTALGGAHPRLLAHITAQPSRYPEPGGAVTLSRREQRVLTAVAGGAPLPEIARELSVSRNTLKSQLRSVYRKLDASGRQEAVQTARRRGLLLISPDTPSGTEDQP